MTLQELMGHKPPPNWVWFTLIVLGVTGQITGGCFSQERAASRAADRAEESASQAIEESRAQTFAIVQEMRASSDRDSMRMVEMMASQRRYVKQTNAELRIIAQHLGGGYVPREIE